MEYVLMHKNIEVCVFDINEKKEIKCLKLLNKEHLPVGTFEDKKLKNWLERRAISIERLSNQDLLKELDVKTQIDLIIKSNGASLSDQYWIKEKNSILNWETINFFDNDFDYSMYEIYISSTKTLDPFPKNHYDNNQLNNANNNLNGLMPKAWILYNGKRVLLKGEKQNIQIFNEAIISKIYDLLNIKHIKYNIARDENNNLHCMCENYINKNTEFISAIDYLNIKNFSFDNKEKILGIEYLINEWEKEGLKNVKEYLIKMIALDFILANEDRHYGNFGVVRNPDTLELIEPFPVFDNGNSLWFNRLSNINAIGIIAICRMEHFTREWDPLFHKLNIKDFNKYLDFETLIKIPNIIEQYYLHYKNKYNINISYTAIQNIKIVVNNNINYLKNYNPKINLYGEKITIEEDDLNVDKNLNNNQNNPKYTEEEIKKMQFSEGFSKEENTNNNNLKM